METNHSFISTGHVKQTNNKDDENHRSQEEEDLLLPLHRIAMDFATKLALLSTSRVWLSPVECICIQQSGRPPLLTAVFAVHSLAVVLR